MIRALAFYTFDGVTYRPGDEIPQAVYDAHAPAHVSLTGDGSGEALPPVEADGDAERDAEGRADDRPALGRMTKKELIATAEAEGVDLSAWNDGAGASTNPERVAAIEAARS